MIFAVLAMVVSVPLFAGPVPSKTAPDQSIAQRSADLNVVHGVLQIDGVTQALQNQGFTKDQVNQRLAQLSDQDLHELSGNIQQIQAAGLTQSEWMWIGIGALAALLLVVLLN